MFEAENEDGVHGSRPSIVGICDIMNRAEVARVRKAGRMMVEYL